MAAASGITRQAECCGPPKAIGAREKGPTIIFERGIGRPINPFNKSNGGGEGDNPLFAGAGTQKEKKEAREPNIRGEEPNWGSTPTRAHGNFEEEREDEDEENHNYTHMEKEKKKTPPGARTLR